MPGKFHAPTGRGKLWRRHVPGEMNGTETRFAELLQARKILGEIQEWYFEAMRLKLAHDSHYTPDFVVLHNDGSLECIDTKGGGPQDPNGNTKLKVAASKHWWFRFTKAVEGKRGSGVWTYTEI